MFKFGMAMFGMCLLMVLLGVIASGMKQERVEAERPVTIVSRTNAHPNSEYVLSADRAYGATPQGLPNPHDTYPIPSTQMINADIYVMNTAGKTQVYLNATHQFGRPEYWAFPSENTDKIDWTGSRLIFIRDTELIAATMYADGLSIEMQIENIQTSRGGTVVPYIRSDGKLITPVFCYLPGDMTTCKYWWYETNTRIVTGVKRNDTFTYLVVLTPGGLAGQYPKYMHIPVSDAEANRFEK